MRIEIDQSGKIEDTNRLTVVAFSNSKSRTLIISGNDKKRIQKLFRETGNTKIFIFKLFAILIFILIKDELNKPIQIVIDREYPGYERLIKQYILEICEKRKIQIDAKSLHFTQIGKSSRAHDLAINAFRSRSADGKIKYRDILEILL